MLIITSSMAVGGPAEPGEEMPYLSPHCAPGPVLRVDSLVDPCCPSLSEMQDIRFCPSCKFLAWFNTQNAGRRSGHFSPAEGTPSNNNRENGITVTAGLSGKVITMKAVSLILNIKHKSQTLTFLMWHCFGFLKMQLYWVPHHPLLFSASVSHL